MPVPQPEETHHATQGIRPLAGHARRKAAARFRCKAARCANVPYSFKARFGDGKGTNPEELIAAAHAGCFTMALSFTLNNAGFTATAIETEARLTMDPVDGKPTITAIHLVDPRAGARHRRRAIRGDRVERQGQLRGFARALAGITVTMDAVAVVLTARARSMAAAVRSGERPRARRSIRRIASAASSARRSTTAGRSRDRRRTTTTPPPPLKTVVRIQPARTHHQPQRFARHPVHAVDQSVPGLRARLHLLLRAADARVSRSFARPRFRDQALRQAQCRGAAARRAREARLPLRSDRARHQHRSVPADRARMEDHALAHRGAGRMRPSADDHDQGRADRARPRPPGADGRQGPRARIRLDRDARPRARAQARPARGGAAPPPAAHQGAERGRHPGRRQRRAGHSAAHRPRARGDPRSGRGKPARGTPAGRCCGCRSRSRRCFATGSPRTIRCARRT